MLRTSFVQHEKDTKLELPLFEDLPHLGTVCRTAPLPIPVLEGLPLHGSSSVQMICTRIGDGHPRCLKGRPDVSEHC